MSERPCAVAVPSANDGQEPCVPVEAVGCQESVSLV